MDELWHSLFEVPFWEVARIDSFRGQFPRHVLKSPLREEKRGSAHTMGGDLDYSPSLGRLEMIIQDVGPLPRKIPLKNKKWGISEAFS